MSTSQIVQVGNRKLLPVKEVVGSVPYSRDYITRLARESKIVAVLIDRQWLVDPESVRSFYEQSKVEEQTRAVQLRSERKRELEVKDFLAEHAAVYHERHARVHQRSLSVATAVVAIGVVTGLVFQSTVSKSDIDRVLQVAQVPFEREVVSVSDVPAAALDLAPTVPVVVYDYGVVEQDEMFETANGILLLPATTSDGVQVLEMLSDPVEVVVVSSSTGLVRMSDGSNKVIPFVQVPVSSDQDAQTLHTTL